MASPTSEIESVATTRTRTPPSDVPKMPSAGRGRSTRASSDEQGSCGCSRARSPPPFIAVGRHACQCEPHPLDVVVDPLQSRVLTADKLLRREFSWPRRCRSRSAPRPRVIRIQLDPIIEIPISEIDCQTVTWSTLCTRRGGSRGAADTLTRFPGSACPVRAVGQSPPAPPPAVGRSMRRTLSIAVKYTYCCVPTPSLP